MKRTVVMLAVACLLALPAMVPADNSGDNGPMSHKVDKKAKAGGPEKVDVIVTYRQMSDAAENGGVNGLGGNVKREYRNFKMKAPRIPS